MPVKVCYQKEIHKLSKSPKDFKALLHALNEIFGKELPEKFSLQYEDSDGDKIVLANDEDYQLAFDSDLSKSFKIYLVDTAAVGNSSFISKSLLDTFESKKTDDSVEKISKAEIIPVKEQKAVQTTIEVTEQKSHKSRCHKGDKPMEFTNIPCDCKGLEAGKTCKSCFGTGLLRKKVAQRREMVQGLIKEAIRQELPNLVKEVKQQLERPAEECMKIEEPQVNKPVHHSVTCDVCGSCPIVGFRYKCTVMDNYDMCESCEALIDHPYPLLKIRNEAQSPIQVLTVLSDSYHMSQESGEVQGLLNNLLSVVVGNNEAPKEQNTQTVSKKEDETPGQTSDETPGQTSDETPGENKEEETPQGNAYDGMFVKEISTIPDLIEVKDLTVYKTISLRNNGMSAWPKNCFIESEGEIIGEVSKLPNIDAGKEFSTVLIIRSPMKAGQFQSKWRFAYTDENSMKKYFGSGFVVEFNIAGEKVEENLFAEPEKKQFAAEVIEKANAVMEIFTTVKFEEVCEYIEHDLSKTIEDLIEDYMSLLE